jgi:queuine/archaeosine tRNA-ribosyltransferase
LKLCEQHIGLFDENDFTLEPATKKFRHILLIDSNAFQRYSFHTIRKVKAKTIAFSNKVYFNLFLETFGQHINKQSQQL